MEFNNGKCDPAKMIDDVKGDQSWRIFRIISEFTEGFDRLSGVCDAVSIFGSARLKPDHPYYLKTIEIAELLGKHDFAVISGGGPGIMEAANKGAYLQKQPSIGLNIELPTEQHPNRYQNISLDFRYFFCKKSHVCSLFHWLHLYAWRLWHLGRVFRSADINADP